MNIKKQLDILIPNSNTLHSFYDHLNIKKSSSPKLHKQLISLFNQRYYNTDQLKGVSYRLLNKQLDKLENELGSCTVLRTNITIQKQLENNIMVIFENIPYYDMVTRTAYVFKSSLIASNYSITRECYSSAIKLLKNNCNKTLEIKVYRVIEIDITKFKYRLKEL